MNIKKILSFIVALILLFVIFLNIVQNFGVIKSFPWRFSFLDLLPLIFFTAIIYIINGLSWYLVNKSLKVEINYFDGLRILIFSNLSRFIPGGIWQYAGRVYIASRNGIPKLTTSTAILIEILLTLTIGLLIVAATATYINLPLLNQWLKILIVVITILIFSIAFWSNQKFMDQILKLTKRYARVGSLQHLNIPVSSLPLLTLSFLGQFFVDGSVLFFLSRSAVDISFGFYPVFIGIFTTAWIIGYLSFFAPSGLGVQELTLAVLLSFFMPFSVASVVALIFRLLFLLSEAITATIILIWPKKA